MKTISFLCALLALLGSRNLCLGGTNPVSNLQLKIQLRDGSRIVGKCGEQTFSFHSDVVGDLKLPVARICSIECPAHTNLALLTTTNGDKMFVQFLPETVRVESSFGTVKLPAALIQQIQVSPVPASNQSGLVALWPGDGNGSDVVGGHNAIVPPDVLFAEADGKCSFYFDGQNHRVIVPDAPDLNFRSNQNFSICAWIKPFSGGMGRTSGIMSILDKRYAPDSAHCQGYELHLDNGRLDIRLSDSAMENGHNFAGGPDLCDGRWHHVAVTVERNSPTGGHLFADGKEILTFDPTGDAGDLSNAEPLRIGNHSDPSYFTFFRGNIRGIALYKRALSESEIQQLNAEE